MRITRKDKNGVVTIALAGSLETGTSSELEVTLSKEVQTAKKIILDFDKLDYVSSAGLQVLLTAQRSCDARGIKMEIVKVNDVVKEVFELTGFNKILTLLG